MHEGKQLVSNNTGSLLFLTQHRSPCWLTAAIWCQHSPLCQLHLHRPPSTKHDKFGPCL